MFQETVPAGKVEKMYGLTKSKEAKIVGMSKARKKREPTNFFWRHRPFDGCGP